MPRPKGSKNKKTLQKENEMRKFKEEQGEKNDYVPALKFSDVNTHEDLDRFIAQEKKNPINVDKQIKGEIFSTIRNGILQSGSRDERPFHQRFIENYLTEAIRDPTSAPAQQLAKIFFKEDLLKELDEQVESQFAREQDFIEYRLLKTMFDKQRDVFLDSFVKTKIVMCSRRAGKTETVKRLLNKCSCTPKSPCCYISLTFDNAINQAFEETLELGESVGLKVSESSQKDGLIKFSNGSSVKFRGNSNSVETEKLRGFKYRLVIIDEAQSQRNLKYLIDDVVSPLLIDYKDSQLVVQGTPPRYSGSYFEELFNQALSKKDPKMKAYSWSMLDNPFLENVQEEIDRICKRKGLTLESPLIQREYLGKLVYDTEALVFSDYKTYHGEAQIQPTHIAIGVDYGFADNNAIIALAYNVKQRKAKVIKEELFNKSNVTEIIQKTNEVYEYAKAFGKAHNPAFKTDNVNIFCDSNEKSITFELSTVYNLPAFNAYKYNKDMALHTLADDCRSGMIEVPANGVCEKEFGKILYKRNPDTDEIIGEIDDDLFHPDGTMALLYGSRQFYYDIGSRAGGVADQSDFEGAILYKKKMAIFEDEFVEKARKIKSGDDSVVWEDVII